MRIVAGRYHVLKHARSGGMGEVFLCRDERTDRRVAVKILGTTDRTLVERFLREAEILAELNHPAIVRHVDHGVHEDVPYLAMEWIEGETLAERLGRGPVSLADVKAIGLRLAEALALVHARGIVHRDVKPANIVLEGGAIERPVLLDFGIAHVVDGSAELTRTGDLLGTPGYMSPEQVSGRAVDARADVFALGCVLFRCLAGRAPFTGTDPLAIAIKILLEDTPRLATVAPNVPRALDEVVARMLSRAKEARPADGEAARLALLRAWESDSSSISVAPPAESGPTLGRRERRVMSLVLARGPTVPSLATIEAIKDVLEETVAKNRAVMDILTDGSILITATAGEPHDVASRAARCALALCDELPDIRAVIVTGHGVMEDDAPVGELVDRAVRLLSDRGGPSPRVVVGEVDADVTEAPTLADDDGPTRRRDAGAAPPSERGGARGGRGSDEPATLAPIRVDTMSAGLLGGRFEIDGQTWQSDGAAGGAWSGQSPTTGALWLRGERADSRPRTLLGKPTPFVGRAREMATLEAMLEECFVESVARAVVVTANPGVGKTRLREEFLRRVRSRHEGRPEGGGGSADGSRYAPAVWLAFADPVSQASPLALAGQLLRDAFGIKQADSLARRQRRILAGVEAVATADPNSPLASPLRTAEFLGEICHVPFPDDDSAELRAARLDPQKLAARMRLAFEELLRAQCARGPLVIVIEDAHWADAASLRLIDGALGAASQSPLLVLCLARPEIAKTHPQLFVDRGGQEIRLLELSRRAAAELVKQVLGASATSETTELVVGRAQGNAFFLEELIRAVAEGRQELPDTVVAMVEARLDDLDPEARKVLRAAAIFGEEASFAGVHALVGGDATELAEVFARLTSLEHLSRLDGGGRRGVEGARYQFRHALVREAAYAMLTEEDRALGHRLAAQWLEGEASHDDLVIARHYERGGDVERARIFFQRAAHQALTSSDLDAACGLAERAIELGATGDRLVALRILQAEANIWRGDPVALGQAADIVAAVPAGTATWFRAAQGVLFAAGHIADFNKVIGTIHRVRAEPLSEDREVATSQACALAVAAWELCLIGMYDLAKELNGRLLELSPRCFDSGHAWIAIARHFFHKYLRADLWEAHLATREALEMLVRINDPNLTVLGRILNGASLVDLGAYAEAEVVLREVMDVCARSSISAAYGDSKRWLAHALEGLGRLDEALRLQAEAEAGSGALIYRGSARAARGYLLACTGRADEGVAAIDSALDLVAFAPSHHSQALGWLARAEVMRGRPEVAVEAASRALRTVEALGAIGAGESTIFMALVEAHEALGSREAAAEAREKARARILARAERIQDPRYRASFLESIPENAWLLGGR